MPKEIAKPNSGKDQHHDRGSLAQNTTEGPFGNHVQELEEKKPFVIRGHHLKVINTVNDRKESPREYAEYQAGAFEKYSWLPGLKGYTRDRMGETPEEREQHVEGLTNFLEEYKNLEPEDTVQIVAGGQKDGICHSCVHGEHCGKESIAKGDAGYLDRISEKAHELGLGQDISMVAKDGMPLSVTTSAGTLDAVIVEFKTKVGNINNLRKYETKYQDPSSK
jgi:hypothetical protein